MDGNHLTSVYLELFQYILNLHVSTSNFTPSIYRQTLINITPQNVRWRNQRDLKFCMHEYYECERNWMMHVQCDFNWALAQNILSIGPKIFCPHMMEELGSNFWPTCILCHIPCPQIEGTRHWLEMSALKTPVSSNRLGIDRFWIEWSLKVRGSETKCAALLRWLQSVMGGCTWSRGPFEAPLWKSALYIAGIYHLWHFCIHRKFFSI